MINQDKTIVRKGFNLRLFIILAIGGVIASAAAIPYLNELISDLIDQLPFEISLSAFNVLIFISTSISMALAVFISIFISRKIGLGAPVLEARLNGEESSINWSSFVLRAIGWGVIVGLSLVVADYLFMLLGSPISLIESDLPAWWKGLIGALYGGIGEELLYRFFFMSLLIWIITKITKSQRDNVSDVAIWLSMIIASLVFGLMHLPATQAVVSLTPLVITRAILLNGIGGMVFGYLYWKKGLLYAMIAHFTADIVLHGLLQLI